MTTPDTPLTIAFVLLTHSPDEPADIERAVDSFANGLRERGHRTLIVAAGPPCRNDHPDLVRLNSVPLPRPMPVDEMPTLLRVVARTDPQKGVAELLRAHPGHEPARPVENVLASARFEWARGIQDQVLDDRAAYHAASQQGPQQAAAHPPAAVAREFLHATMAGAPEVS
ncbi:hypothetical protein [Streptomyces iranensis]|uniref:Uncharacterized protein n=1 Tax=Streptomyces iranensis TaxID=576784 RepID=A0A061A7P0_9ACTN|nr:hypothetical protein [Streptomyces iranensis]MBP2066184.1 hypothetical protein [Streptomyces iranensis]CDR13090.1 predicted protein [Streptomyces iranensis]